MIKNLLISMLAVSAIFTGCVCGECGDNPQFVQIKKTVTVKILCDRDTDMAYVVHYDGGGKGFSIYYNRDGKPAKCSDVH